jgi:hypothetical protein
VPIKKARKDEGFTLVYAVILSVVFAGLLFAVYYFLKINLEQSSKGIFKLQSIYLAESGNNRGLARMNVMTLPDLEIEDVDLDELAEDDFFAEDDDFWDEDWSEEEDEDLFSEDDEDSFADEEERYFLAQIPRYINFYHKNIFFVNVDTGAIISEGQYYALVQEQKNRIQLNRQNATNPDEIVQETLVEEIYFPLPEVNVAKIGSLPIKKGIHLKPGFKIKLAENVPLKLKQKNIVDEYENYIPPLLIEKPRTIIREINPNYAYPGDYVDIRIDGANMEGIFPQFSTADLSVLEAKNGFISIAISEQAKPGRYQVKLGPATAEFYIVPIATQAPAPNINDIILAQPRNNNPQFISIGSKEKLENVKISGENLSNGKDAPVVIPDKRGIIVEIVSFKTNEIICNISTEKAEEGVHYLSVFTEGGQSNSWTFNVEKLTVQEQQDPYTGTYSTVLTLLEVKSLSNLPLKSIIEGSPTGRPESAGTSSSRPSSSNTPTTNTAGGGRPGSDQQSTNSKKSFDLLRSDLDTVWKLETIATVNNVSYKETRIIRRSEPRAGAAITTNSAVSFGQSNIKIEGMLEAITRLVEPYSFGDADLIVEGKDPNQDDFMSREEENRPPSAIMGSAVIEDLGFGVRDESPSSKGFKPGGIISITSSSRTNAFTDFGFIQSVGPNSITVKDPGFQANHFPGDDVTQFIPAVITPEPMSERDSRKNLDPPGAVVRMDGLTSFEYVFRTKLNKMSNWSNAKTTDTKVPNNLIRDYEGYLGLSIVEGVPSYSGSNALYGQGTLIIDTTLGGRNPAGSTVTISGSGKLPSIFDGLIYIIGNVQITGATEIAGAIIVNSPNDKSTIRISGSGNISYSPNSVKKAILHLPFCEEPRTRILEKSRGQQEILEGFKE